MYTGRDIRAAHARPREHGLNDSHFDALLKHFQASLEELGIAAEHVNEVMRLLESARAAVLRPLS